MHGVIFQEHFQQQLFVKDVIFLTIVSVIHFVLLHFHNEVLVHRCENKPF